MTANIRIGNFNLENLFTRHSLLDTEKSSRGKKPIDPQKFVKEGGTILMLKRQLDKLSLISGNQRSKELKGQARILFPLSFTAPTSLDWLYRRRCLLELELPLLTGRINVL